MKCSVHNVPSPEFFSPSSQCLGPSREAMQEFVSSGVISQVASGTRQPARGGPRWRVKQANYFNTKLWYRSPPGSSFPLLNLTHRALFRNRPPSLPVNVSLQGWVTGSHELVVNCERCHAVGDDSCNVSPERCHGTKRQTGFIPLH